MTDTKPLIIRLGHQDPANQQPYPPFNRLYEYTDFSAREVRVHRGDLVNFQTPAFAFNIVALAADEKKARQTYPIVKLNPTDPPAVGTGLPTVSFSDGAFPVVGGSLDGGGEIHRDKGKGPPVVGAVQFGQAPGVFNGGDSVEVIGPVVGWDFDQRPTTIDQLIVMDAPPGTYYYFDMLHPGMSGTLRVVPDEQPRSSQDELDREAAENLAKEREVAQQLEAKLESSPDVAGTPGDRDIMVHVGASTSDGRVGVHRMMPSQLPELTTGDRVHFLVSDQHGVHTVCFAPSFEDVVSPFGFECSNGVYRGVPNVFNAPPENPCGATDTDPKFLCDPGTHPSGAILESPDKVISSGVLLGSAYDVSPLPHCWSIRIGPATAKGEYRFFDGVHPWMSGTLTVT